MALSDINIKELRVHLDNCKKPIFFFDDDQDGLCSFLQFYRYKKGGKGFIVKNTPKIGIDFIKRVEEYQPDKVFILDIAIVEQDFLDEMSKINIPVVWVDHHGPFKRDGVEYFNPRISKKHDNQPTSFICHQVVQNDLWIAAVGCLADWFLPPFMDELKKKFPELIDKPYKTPGDIIYNTKIGQLTRVFSFVFKGTTQEVRKCINTLTKVDSPYEIINQESARGKFIYKRYEQINKKYEPLLREVLKTIEASKEKLAIFKYNEDSTSFTSDLSNEAIFRNPDKIILIGRRRGDEMKCSLRSSKIILPVLVENALSGLEGYGGGHEHACGLNIKTHNFDEFVGRLRELIGKEDSK